MRQDPTVDDVAVQVECPRPQSFRAPCRQVMSLEELPNRQGPFLLPSAILDCADDAVQELSRAVTFCRSSGLRADKAALAVLHSPARSGIGRGPISGPRLAALPDAAFHLLSPLTIERPCVVTGSSPSFRHFATHFAAADLLTKNLAATASVGASPCSRAFR